MMASGGFPISCPADSKRSSCVKRRENGPVYGWCQWHYTDQFCGLVISTASWSARIKAILRKENCKQFKKGACGRAFDSLAAAQARFYAEHRGAKGASKGRAELLDQVPSNPYGTE
jgi:hypothetical protein